MPEAELDRSRLKIETVKSGVAVVKTDEGEELGTVVRDTKGYWRIPRHPRRFPTRKEAIDAVKNFSGKF